MNLTTAPLCFAVAGYRNSVYSVLGIGVVALVVVILGVAPGSRGGTGGEPADRGGLGPATWAGIAVTFLVLLGQCYVLTRRRVIAEFSNPAKRADASGEDSILPPSEGPGTEDDG